MHRHRISSAQIKSGEKTQTIYGWIRDGNYRDAIALLTEELFANPNSRAALSLLAYCHYTIQEFGISISYYEQLVQLFPEEKNYLLNFTKCLFQAGEYDKSLRITYQYVEKFINIEQTTITNNNDNINNQNIIQNSNNMTTSTLLPNSYDEFAEAEIIKLQSAIKYVTEDDLVKAKILIEQLPDSNTDKYCNLGCILFKEKKFIQATELFNNCLQMELLMSGTGQLIGSKVIRDHPISESGNEDNSIINLNNATITTTATVKVAATASTTTTMIRKHRPDLLYNLSVCHFSQRQYSEALQFIADIIEQGIREHPELAIGSGTEGLEIRSVGNTEALHDSVLIEAFNLKAAIEYQTKNFNAAHEALTDMPPRAEEELDAVTLHNMALLSIDSHPVEGFEKLQFLVSQDSFPPETFPNLLLLYCKHEYFELAADLMAENANYTYRYLSPHLYEFLDALITQQTSPEDAYQKFDEIATRHLDVLRRASKKLQEIRSDETNMNSNKIARALEQYKASQEQYMPVLMAQAKIYWDLEAYEQVEKIFRKSAEFCQQLDTWLLNVAHVLFMQENKFKEAAGFYEQLVKKSYENILNVSAIVLANLCVSYIMTGQNEDAEELMRKIEKEEEKLVSQEPDRKVFHHCTVNLVIGTLYCAKGNFEFGISRVIKSLEPYPKKLGTDTWYYAKRCFLAMLDSMAKQTVIICDSVLDDCKLFLTQCEIHGRNIKASVEPPLELETLHPGKNTVTYEARLLCALLLEIMDG